MTYNVFGGTLNSTLLLPLLRCWFAQSVLHAPTTCSCVELSLAIANRSAVFFHLGDYEAQYMHYR